MDESLSQKVSILLTKEEKRSLDDVSNQIKRSRSNLIRKFILEGLKKTIRVG